MYGLYGQGKYYAKIVINLYIYLIAIIAIII